MNTQPGLIGIQTTPGQLNIHNRQARLVTRQEVGQISVETRKPKLEISQYAARARLGFKNTGDAVAQAAARGAQQVLQFIAGKTQEGQRLRAIEKGGNAIREIAIDKAWPEKRRRGGFTPFAGPDFHVTPGEVFVTPPYVENPIHPGYEADYYPGKLNIQYQPGKVNVYMRQYPEIRIDVAI